MASKTQVIDTHIANPTWCARQIADHLKCIPEYVHAIGHRTGLKYPSGKGYKGPPRLDQRKSRLRRQLGDAALKAGLTVEKIQMLAS